MLHFSASKFSYTIHCLLKRKYRNEKTCSRKKGPHLTECSQSRESQSRKDDLAEETFPLVLKAAKRTGWGAKALILGERHSSPDKEGRCAVLQPAVRTS